MTLSAIPDWGVLGRAEQAGAGGTDATRTDDEDSLEERSDRRGADVHPIPRAIIPEENESAEEAERNRNDALLEVRR